MEVLLFPKKGKVVAEVRVKVVIQDLFNIHNVEKVSQEIKQKKLQIMFHL